MSRPTSMCDVDLATSKVTPLATVPATSNLIRWSADGRVAVIDVLPPNASFGAPA